MKQQREILKKQKETADKIAARAFAQSYLADLVPSVFGTLSDNGYFYDPVERGKGIGQAYRHRLCRSTSEGVWDMKLMNIFGKLGSFLRSLEFSSFARDRLWGLARASRC